MLEEKSNINYFAMVLKIVFIEWINKNVECTNEWNIILTTICWEVV